MRREEGKDVAVDKLYPWPPEERRLSEASEAVLELVAQVFPPLRTDRTMSEQVAAIARLIGEGTINAAVAEHVELS